MSEDDIKDDISEGLLYEIKLSEAIRRLPEVPDLDVLWLLAMAAAAVPRHIKDRGKELQRVHGLEAIPPKAELEWAAGLWSVIRAALLKEKELAAR